MHRIWKRHTLLGYRFKCSAQPLCQNCLVEVGQSNAQIHSLDQFLTFRKAGLIRYIKEVRIPGFTNPPGLRVFDD